MRHFSILTASHILVEGEPQPFGSLGYGIPRLPAEIVNWTYQDVSQSAVFAVYTPELRPGCSAAVYPRTQRLAHHVTARSVEVRALRDL